MKQITLISEKLQSDYLQQAHYLAIYKSMKMEIDIYINREIKDYLSEYAKKQEKCLSMKK